MAITTTSQFNTAKEAPWSGGGYEPVFLVEIASASLYLSSRNVTLGGIEYSNILEKLSRGGLGNLNRGFDTYGRLQIGSTSVRILNQALYSDILDTYTLNQAAVVVKLGFYGGVLADYITLFNGVIDSISTSYEHMELSVLDQSVKLQEPLAALIGQKYFRGAPGGRGSPIPIVLGRTINLGTYQVEAAAVGTLAADVGAGDTVIYIDEIGATFPEAGTFNVGGAESIDYTSRSITSLSGNTVLAFSGLTRGSPTTHSAGDTVTLTGIDYTYLVGYECQAVNTIREDGAVVSAGLTTTLDASGRADQDVTIVVSTTQRGTMTVDADGLNLDTTNLVSNGDAETGDMTGWTVDDTTVQAQAVEVYEGGYSFEAYGVTIGGTPAKFHEDITTVVGQRYELNLFHMEEQAAGVDIVSNGDFETGDLTGWTTEAGATPSVQAGGFGSYLLKIIRDDPSEAGVYQDKSVVVGESYSAAYYYAGQAIDQEIYVKLGTTADPDAYISSHVTITSVTSLQLLSLGSFTPTDGTLRVSIQAANTGAALGIFVDNMQVTHTDYAETTLKIGTTGDDDAIASKVLVVKTDWTTDGTTFVATATTTRVTLESENIAHVTKSSFIDMITCTSISTNPAATIRYLLENFSSLTLDDDAFDSAEDLLGGWAFSGVITENGPALEVAQRLGNQCKSRVFLDFAGNVTIKPYDSNATSIYSFTESNMHDVKITWSSMEEVYTEVVVWFAPKAGSNSAADYQGVTYANPTETTHATLSLDTNCATALAQYGFSRKLEVYASMIHDVTTADKWLEYLVKYYTEQKCIASFRSFLNAPHLEETDVVDITHDLLRDDLDGGNFRVEKKGIDPPTLATIWECWQLMDVG